MMRADEMLEAFVAVPSPTRHEQPATAWLLERAVTDGLDARIDAAGNVVASAGDGPFHILFVGHIDVVEPHLPVRREDGWIWGRGTVDAKGCLVAAYHAMVACRNSRDVRFTFVAAVGEESDSRGTLGLQVDRPDAIINGEPSGWDGITVGYKGIVRGSFEATGEPRHGGHPEPNVLDRVFAWWAQVCARLDAATGFDRVQAHIDAIEHTRDTVERSGGHFQIRVPPGTPTAAVRQALHDAGTHHGVAADVDEALEAATSDPRSPLVAAFRTAIRAQGGTPRILHKTGTSDFNHLAVRFPGVPIIAYGPGDSSLDHTPEERIEVTHLERSIAVWHDAIDQLAARLVPRSDRKATTRGVAGSCQCDDGQAATRGATGAPAAGTRWALATAGAGAVIRSVRRARGSDSGRRRAARSQRIQDALARFCATRFRCVKRGLARAAVARPSLLSVYSIRTGVSSNTWRATRPMATSVLSRWLSVLAGTSSVCSRLLNRAGESALMP